MTILTAFAKNRPMPACVAVTGAGGFIGGRVAQLLGQEPEVAEIRKFSRRGERANQVKRLRLDDVSTVGQALIGCGAVVHCAFNMYSMESNIRIADVLGRACAAARIRLVHVSTAAVYEPLPDGNLNERFPVQLTDPYSATKAAIEDLLTEYSNDLGLDVVILQPTIVYGPGGRAWTDSPVRELLFGSVVLPNEGRGLCNAVFVDDVCLAAINAIKADIPAGERFLISGPTPVEWREFFQSYENMIGKRSLVLQPKGVSPKEVSAVDASDSSQTTSVMIRFMDRAKAMFFGRLNGKARGHINMLFRKIRSALVRNTITTPKGATLALYSSRCDIRIDKACALIGYVPQFDLERGMAITAGYVQRQYCKEIAWRNRA
jgi:nucleoside-diphosphate-sugar epimerase